MAHDQKPFEYDFTRLTLSDRQQMATRPAVVQAVQRMAFEALARQSIPDDSTPQEEAEGLIAHAVALLQKSVGDDAATSAHWLVDKHARWGKTAG